MAETTAAAALATLHEVAQVVNAAAHDLDTILQDAAHIARERMGVDACTIYLLEGRVLTLRATDGLPRELIGKVSLHLGEGLSGWAAANRRPVVAARALEDPRSVHAPRIAGDTFCSLAAAPLLFRGAVVGVINIQTAGEHAFSEIDTQLLCAIAHQIAGVVRNVQFHLKNTRSLHESIAINEAAKLINSTLELDEVLAHICECSTNIANADGCLLRLVQPQSHHLDLVSCYHRVSDHDDELIVRFEAQHAQCVINEGFPRFYTSAQESEFFPALLPATFSMITAPISAKTEPCGTISVYTRGRAEGPLTMSDRRLIITLASHAGIAIENARLFRAEAEARRRLREAQQQLIAAEKLAALGQMAAGVAHELRNPLVSIGGFSERIRKNPHNSEQVQQYAAIVVAEVRRLEALVRDILHYAAPAKADLKTVDLLEIIRSVQGLLRMEEKEHHRLTVNIAADLRFVIGDYNMLLRVLLNLVQNGFDAMPDGGDVIIRALRSLDAREWVVLHIQDCGVGIPEEKLDRIFDPFYTTKADGTGLGLAIVKSLVESMHGTIRVSSKAGEGTTFTLTLPRAMESAAASP